MWIALNLNPGLVDALAEGKIREELPGIHFTDVGYKGRGACNTHPAIFIQSSLLPNIELQSHAAPGSLRFHKSTVKTVAAL